DAEPDPDRSAEEEFDALAESAAPSPRPSRAELTVDAIRRPLAMGRQAMAGAIGALGNPVGAAMTAADIGRQALAPGPPGSPLWSGRRSVHRRFEILSTDLESAKQAAKAMGGTLNDLLVTAVAGAAGAYHRAMGVAVDELRAAIPVSTRA